MEMKMGVGLFVLELNGSGFEFVGVERRMVRENGSVD